MFQMSALFRLLPQSLSHLSVRTICYSSPQRPLMCGELESRLLKGELSGVLLDTDIRTTSLLALSEKKLRVLIVSKFFAAENCRKTCQKIYRLDLNHYSVKGSYIENLSARLSTSSMQTRQQAYDFYLPIKELFCALDESWHAGVRMSTNVATYKMFSAEEQAFKGALGINTCKDETVATKIQMHAFLYLNMDKGGTTLELDEGGNPEKKLASKLLLKPQEGDLVVFNADSDYDIKDAKGKKLVLMTTTIELTGVDKPLELESNSPYA